MEQVVNILRGEAGERVPAERGNQVDAADAFVSLVRARPDSRQHGGFEPPSKVGGDGLLATSRDGCAGIDLCLQPSELLLHLAPRLTVENTPVALAREVVAK